MREGGWAMIEIILGLLLLGAVAGVTLWVVAQRSDTGHQLTLTGRIATEATLSQEAALIGGPFRGDVHWGALGGSTAGPQGDDPVGYAHQGRLRSGVVSRPPLDTPEERAFRAGLWLEAIVLPPPEERRQLAPPIVTKEGELDPAWFPLFGLVEGHPDHPPGTYVRYRWDADTPNRFSPIWDPGVVLEATEFRPYLSLQAFHPDPYFQPSEVVTVEFTATAPPLEVGRLEGGTSPYFSPLELEEGGNPVVLNFEDLLGGFWGARYTLDGTSPYFTSPAYAGPFTPEFGEATEIPLRAALFPLNLHFEPGPETVVYLHRNAPVLRIREVVEGEIPFGLPEGAELNQSDPGPGDHEIVEPGDVWIEARAGWGYRVEWEGVDEVVGDRARVWVGEDREVEIRYLRGTIVQVEDEGGGLLSDEQYRYRMAGAGEWSEWRGIPDILVELDPAETYDFELLRQSEYRSLYGVWGYQEGGDPAERWVVLRNHEPRLRALYARAGEYQWAMPAGGPDRVFVEMIGGGAAGAPGWVSRGGYWHGLLGQWIPFEFRLQSGAGGGSGHLAKSIVMVDPGELLALEVGSGGEPSRTVQWSAAGDGYEIWDGSEYLNLGGVWTTRGSGTGGYPETGGGSTTRLRKSGEVVLDAAGGEPAVHPYYPRGNMVSYIDGGSGGFGGGAGAILSGGSDTLEYIPIGSPSHPLGGESHSTDFVFYEFSALEFGHGGMSGGIMWWMSNVYVDHYEPYGGRGGSATGYAQRPEEELFPTGASGGDGRLIPWGTFSYWIPAPGWGGDALRETPAAEYRYRWSLPDQHEIFTLLDFVPGGGGGAGVRLRDPIAGGDRLVGEQGHPAETGWYAATWSNVYFDDAPFGEYHSAGHPGEGFGAGGGGASSPWSHPDTWGERGMLGHFDMIPPPEQHRLALNHLPDRGVFGQTTLGSILPGLGGQPNARGLVGPEGGRGADGAILIYY